MVIHISALVWRAASSLRANGGGDARVSVEEAGEGSAVDAEAGGEGGHFGVAHELLEDFAGMCGVVHGHGVLPVV